MIGFDSYLDIKEYKEIDLSKDILKDNIKDTKALYKELTKIEKEAALEIKFTKREDGYIFGKTPYIKALEEGLNDQGIRIKVIKNRFRITVGNEYENRVLINGIRSIFIYKG